VVIFVEAVVRCSLLESGYNSSLKVGAAAQLIYYGALRLDVIKGFS